MEMYQCASCLQTVPEDSIVFIRSGIPKAQDVLKQIEVFLPRLYKDLIKLDRPVLCSRCIKNIEIGHDLTLRAKISKNYIENLTNEARINLNAIDAAHGGSISAANIINKIKLELPKNETTESKRSLDDIDDIHLEDIFLKNDQTTLKFQTLCKIKEIKTNKKLKLTKSATSKPPPPPPPPTRPQTTNILFIICHACGKILNNLPELRAHNVSHNIGR